MIIEVWVVITGKGDRPYYQPRRPSPELVEKWHREEGGVRVVHLAAQIDESGDPKKSWATVEDEPTTAEEELLEHFGSDPDDSRQLYELRQAIDQYLGWPDTETEEKGDYVARIVDLGKRLGRTTEPAPEEPELDAEGRPKLRYSVERHGMTRCQDHDGECFWKGCPQKRDGEPKKTGRHCPLDICPENADDDV